MGDFNWVTPSFVAFASPQQQPVEPIPFNTPEYAALPSTTADVIASDLPSTFKIVLNHFATNDVGLVVRLNSELYCPSYFTALGIEHLDMIFEDGTCPTMPMVRKFIRLAHRMINVNKKSIAVHCKAGLGRTGCLIGAYLIYRYGFSADEVIGYMRFMRPGMVVGPQQHWLHLNQGEFREWWYHDSAREKAAASAPATPSKVARDARRVPSDRQASTPRRGSARRSILGEMGHNDGSMPNHTSAHDAVLPAPTPGQPRKYLKIAEDSTACDSDHNNQNVKPATEISTVKYSLKKERCGSDGDEELQLQLQARRRKVSRSPKNEKRSVSYTATTTTNSSFTRRSYFESDTENQSETPSTPPQSQKSTSGNGALSMSKVRSSSRKVSEQTTNMRETSGVRKNSGRIGSNGTSSTVKVKIST
jgi:cell division cycle 14